jgi:gliding motility-associated-like protein
MVRKILIFILIVIAFPSFAQLTVTNNLTVEQYVQNVLLGNGVTVSNIEFNGIPANLVNASVGAFNDPASNLGLTSGLIMGSGNVQMASQPNNAGGSSLGGTGAMGVDTDLQSITSNPIFDESVIEFDFVPSGDTISFRYVFASEEYPEYVCGSVNDAFGFFLTGFNPNGPAYNAKNIALIPDPNNPGTFTNTPVSINTVNPGIAGFSGDSTTCESIDPTWESYSVFYAGNNTGTAYEYDGNTVVLTAVAAVKCGETYHIKLAIGDAGDAAFDSGVFLEANSFNSSGLSITANITDTYEGCGNGYFIVTRSDTLTNDVVPLLIQGSATNGEDYTLINDTVFFEAGALTDTILLEPLVNDDLGVTSETVEIIINTGDACGGPVITILNVDPMTVSINLGDTLCPEAPLSESHVFTSTVSGGIPLGYSYVWIASPFYDFGAQQGQPTVTVSPQETTVYQLVVGDICGNAVGSQFEEVYVECLLSIPNVFTPDGDGKNDFFEIRNIEDYPDAELVILNRWGTVVYETAGYKNDWKGDDLTEGVYFYKLYPNGRKYETGMYSGFFHLIR